MIKGVIFDMDGVLVNNMKVHMDVFALFCQKYGQREDVEDINKYAGMGNNDIMPLVLPKEVIEKYGVEALSNEKEKMYRDYYVEFMQPAEGLIPFLQDLITNNIRRAVGSSGQKLNVDFVLDNCDLRQYFDAVVNGDMVTRHKPDPEIFLKAAEAINLSPEECLVIEDSISGIEAAHRAGMKVVALPTTFNRELLEEKAKPNMIIDSFNEISVDVIRTKLDKE